MIRKVKDHAVLVLLFVIFLHMLFLASPVFAKSRHPISDSEIRMRKDECYTDIESGMWGWDCKSSMIAKENCALRCLSSRCYDLIYASDPLEEGEKDLVRSQEYKFCMIRDSQGESLEGIKGFLD